VIITAYWPASDAVERISEAEVDVVDDQHACGGDVLRAIGIQP
jgi:hypothetical protein